MRYESKLISSAQSKGKCASEGNRCNHRCDKSGTNHRPAIYDGAVGDSVLKAISADTVVGIAALGDELCICSRPTPLPDPSQINRTISLYFKERVNIKLVF